VDWILTSQGTQSILQIMYNKISNGTYFCGGKIDATLHVRNMQHNDLGWLVG
jgi:hypothetical protein